MNLPDLEGTFSTIVADPPWRYGNQGTRNAASKKYATVEILVALRPPGFYPHPMAIQAEPFSGLDLLRSLVPQEEWRTRAACRGRSVDIFFPEDDHHRRGELYGPARSICAGCEVRSECAQVGATEHFGCWGGLTEPQRHPKSRRRRLGA
jgi:WhiB family redox-sensing transcriptional regulator